jgi:malonyl-CoA decarboxylase
MGDEKCLVLETLSEKNILQLGKAVGFQPPTADHFLFALDRIAELGVKSPVSQTLMSCAAQYLGLSLSEGEPVDPVARFHLGNGARVERINWAADPSSKGNKQSYGLMVNYLYDLKRLDKHRNMLAQGKIPVSSDVENLYS